MNIALTMRNESPNWRVYDLIEAEENCSFPQLTHEVQTTKLLHLNSSLTSFFPLHSFFFSLFRFLPLDPLSTPDFHLVKRLSPEPTVDLDVPFVFVTESFEHF